MIKAVCFDFYNTLATYDPPREHVYANIASELGVKVEEKALFKSLSAADIYYRDENSRWPIDKRPPEEKIAFYADYATRIFSGAGADISKDAALQVLGKLRTYNWKFKIYEDTLPTLKALKERGLTIGLISNVAQDMEHVYKELGIQPYLSFKVTSAEVGYDKPKPGIFLAALSKAKVKPAETIHIGDQYDLDIVGARGVGITGILLDRNNHFPEITDCPRILSLSDIIEFIQTT
jgi:REG-2-like HAD superfamily hydrolase